VCLLSRTDVVVAQLFLPEIDLTGDEIDLFCPTEAGVWFLRSAVKGTPRQ
jgi:hypothetical protein